MMDDDFELLESAAKAAGYEIEWVRNSGCYYRCEKDASREAWDALDDDGDAFRLAVKLHLTITMLTGECEVLFDIDGREHSVVEGNGEEGELSNEELTRRAIVRAAAAIGRAMP